MATPTFRALCLVRRFWVRNGLAQHILNRIILKVQSFSFHTSLKYLHKLCVCVCVYISFRKLTFFMGAFNFPYTKYFSATSDFLIYMSRCNYLLGRRKWQPTPVFLPENPMNGEAWHATVQRVEESDTTEPLSTYTIHLKNVVVVWRKI